MTDLGISFRKFLVEIPHGYIGKSVHSLMEGYEVPFQMCSPDLINYIKLHGIIPHREGNLSPDEHISSFVTYVRTLKSLNEDYMSNPLEEGEKN